MNQRNLAPLFIIFIVVFAALGIGTYYAKNRAVPTPVACTMEAKLCPDGSYVGRVGPRCEFAECPAAPNPTPTSECTKDSDCPSSQYVCVETQGMGTACPSNDPSCVPTHVVIKGECKLKEGNRCNANSDCAAGNLCNRNVCVSPIGRQCTGPSDTSCPADFECVEGCGPPVVRYPDDTPPAYFCELKGYMRPCPICLASNTSIATPGGDLNVQTLKVGMQVWSLDKNGKKIASTIRAVSRTPVPNTHRVVHLVLADNREVWVSPGHPAANGKTVSDLRVGDRYDNSEIVSAELVPYGDSYTYDLLPDSDTGYYWANGILLGSTLH